MQPMFTMFTMVTMFLQVVHSHSFWCPFLDSYQTAQHNTHILILKCGCPFQKKVTELGLIMGLFSKLLENQTN